MNRMRSCVLAAVLLTVGTGGCAEQTRTRVNAQPRVEQAASSINIDPRASQALRRMSETLGQAASFSFTADMAMDEPLETGQMGQFSRQAHLLVHRPDKLFVRTKRNDDVWMLWYQGTDLTLLDSARGIYASLKVPSRIDRMIDDVASQHGLTVPLADLLSPDPYEVMTTGVLTGKYIGQTKVEADPTDHLLFTHDALDWQIWIQTGPQPVPRKIVIDYKRLPGRPQFTAVLSDWSFSTPTTDEPFAPVVPKDAKKVEISALLRKAEGA